VTKSTGDFWPGPDFPQGTYAPPDSWGTLTLGNESLAEKPEWPKLPEAPLEMTYLYIIVAAIGGVVVVSAVVFTMRKRGKSKAP